MSIKIHNNSLASLRQYFSDKLKEKYEATEVDSFFFMAMEHFLGKSRLSYMQDPEQSVSESDILRFRSLSKELMKNRPIQYILGETEFMGLKLKVREGVLIPRPETEEIMADVFEKVKDAKLIYDLCSGSGCMGLSTKSKWPASRVIGIEKSDTAISIAKENARLNKLDLEFHKGDILKGIKSMESCDLILSNPPYVTESEKRQMQANVLDHEPHMALFVPDEDPLIFYKSIVKIAVDKLVPGGWLFMEINEKFGKEMEALCLELGLKDELSINQDLNGKDRWISVKR